MRVLAFFAASADSQVKEVAHDNNNNAIKNFYLIILANYHCCDTSSALIDSIITIIGLDSFVREIGDF